MLKEYDSSRWTLSLSQTTVVLETTRIPSQSPTRPLGPIRLGPDPGPSRTHTLLPVLQAPLSLPRSRRRSSISGGDGGQGRSAVKEVCGGVGVRRTSWTSQESDFRRYRTVPARPRLARCLCEDPSPGGRRTEGYGAKGFVGFRDCQGSILVDDPSVRTEFRMKDRSRGSKWRVSESEG